MWQVKLRVWMLAAGSGDFIHHCATSSFVLSHQLDGSESPDMGVPSLPYFSWHGDLCKVIEGD